MALKLADIAHHLKPHTVPPCWLVRTGDGRQFSTHDLTPEGRERADFWAARIGGTVEHYTPTQATYWDGTPRYDH